jgi:hypothetical protein
MNWLNDEQRINCLLCEIDDLKYENKRCREKLSDNIRKINELKQIIKEIKEKQHESTDE